MVKRAVFLKLFKYSSLLAMLCLLYGFFIEPKTLTVRHVEIISEAWQGSPLKIGLMSDVHIGGIHVDAERAKRLANKMNSYSPDIVLIAGDYVNGHLPAKDWSVQKRTNLELGIRNMGFLKAPLGVFSVYGNHDAWYGVPELGRMLNATSIRTLENKHINVQAMVGIREYNFCLIGLADFQTGTNDLGMLENCEKGQSVLAFMHSPDSFHLLRTDTALALAGHTHGGQINLPIYGRRAPATQIVGHEYAYGYVDYENIPTFITAGIGTSILPARFRSPPEIVIITLRSP
jgi:uncharacterized protein